jgi:hypothetical protein
MNTTPNSQLNANLMKKHRAIRPKPSSTILSNNTSTPIISTPNNNNNAIKINTNYHTTNDSITLASATTINITPNDSNDILSKATSMILSPNEFLVSPNNNYNQISPSKIFK